MSPTAWGRRGAPPSSRRPLARQASVAEDEAHDLLRRVHAAVEPDAVADALEESRVAEGGHDHPLELRPRARDETDARHGREPLVALLLTRERAEADHRQFGGEGLGEGEAARLRHEDIGCRHHGAYVIHEAEDLYSPLVAAGQTAEPCLESAAVADHEHGLEGGLLHGEHGARRFLEA